MRLRRAMLAHPDGARIVSAAHLSPTMAAVSELAMRTLVDRGLPLRQARLTVLVVERFTIGHVLEEQSPRQTRTRLMGSTTTRSPSGIPRWSRPSPTTSSPAEPWMICSATASN
jgi:Tetracyclin repressor-like, C-terminal domain